MASYGEIHQRPNTPSNSTSQNNFDESKGSTGVNQNDFKLAEFGLVCPFNIPSSPDAAALRIVRNLNHFALYYTHFVWIVLFITLIPKRKVSLILLVIMTYVGSLYLLLLSAVPKSNIIHKILDKRIVLPLIVIATMIQLMFTHAAIHLLVTLAATLPVVLVHSVLWITEYCSVQTQSSLSGELLPLVDDHESTAMV